MHKSVRRQRPRQDLAEELRKFARSLIAWFSDNASAFADPDKAARHYFIQAPPMHLLGCHIMCPSFFVCRSSCYALSREVRFFTDQKDQSAKANLINRLRSLLMTCWPEGAKVVTKQRSSRVDTMRLIKNTTNQHTSL